jgi:hypothetical protein
MEAISALPGAVLPSGEVSEEFPLLGHRRRVRAYEAPRAFMRLLMVGPAGRCAGSTNIRGAPRQDPELVLKPSSSVLRVRLCRLCPGVRPRVTSGA